MNKTKILSKITEGGVVPVVRAASAHEARACAAALVEGGITVLEITMTVPHATQLISQLTDELPDDVLIGAGSVLDAESARACIAAGANFIVSPVTDYDTIQYCVDSEITVLPGALTPTEIANAVSAGADIVKVFPADSMGGAAYLKSLLAPMPQLKLIPTGGVTVENAGDLIRAGAVAVGVGSDLVDLTAIRDGHPERIVAKAKSYLEAVATARAAK